MRFLLFSDLHCDVTAARKLVELARTVDVVVGAGDFGNQRRGLNACLKVLREIDRPKIYVAGNNESTEELAAACGSWPLTHVLHGSSVTVAGVQFFGLGGGIPVTPFGDWSYDLSEATATALLESCPMECVLVTHSPPKGWVDVSSSGQSLGSTSIRDTILRCHPQLVVCGHIHASGGQQAHHGKTVIVNAGPGGVVLDVNAMTFIG